MGVDKLSDNLEAAMERVRQDTSPLDARQLDKDMPCVKLGKCIAPAMHM